MQRRSHLVAGLGLWLVIAGNSANAQHAVGTPVDRNVADTGPNAVSQRHTQPGLGQFGVGSLLLDRFGESSFEPTRHDRFADPRVNQRYLLRSQGIQALISRPDYIGPSPQGGWVRNGQTFDGTEVLTMTAANTVYILSPELLNAPAVAHTRVEDSPYRVQPQIIGDPYAVMRDARITGQRYTRPSFEHLQRPGTYRHPEIIERQRKLREEREAEREDEGVTQETSTEQETGSASDTGRASRDGASENTANQSKPAED